MKIYFYSNQYLNHQDAKAGISYFKKSGVDVVDNLNSSENSFDNISLDIVDALVFQGNKLDTKISYLIALVLAQNKEVLCLFPDGSKLDPALEGLKLDKKLSKKLNIELYNNENLNEKMLNFLKKVDNDSIRNLFNIKYTLRISGKISDYLNWKARKNNIKKADWIRDKIQNIMQEDKDYQNFLKNKFKA